MTHIENILPEMVGSEVQRLLVSDADGLAAAALYDLVRKATGCRLPQTDSTPSSEVEELLALCSAVLRRHWQTPLTMLEGLSLQDLVSRLMADRMEGNAPLGIPAVNGSVTEALSALLERKITGAPEVADGMSLVRLFCDSAINASLTTLTDPTTGWTTRIDGLNKILSAFPNAKDITLGFAIATGRLATSSTVLEQLNMPNFEVQEDGHLLEGDFPAIQEISIPVVQIKSTGNWTQSLLRNNPSTKVLRCPRLKYMTNNIGDSTTGGTSKLLVYNCSGIEEIYAEELEEFNSNINGAGGIASTAPNLRKVVVGNIRIWYCRVAGPYFFDNYLGATYDNLIHLEFKSLSCSLNLKNWTATTALSSNLLQFLSNFREFLFLRLADRTGQSALTLTLSQAVYQAITGTDTTTTALTLTLNQLGITDLTDKETQAGITLNTTYATWLETYRDAINWNIGYV